MMMTSQRLVALIGSCLLVVSATAGALAQTAPLVFGVLNQQSPALTAERWNPILHYVSTNSGVALRFRMGATVQDTDAMMGRGEFDFMFTNHNFQPEYEPTGYRVIARWGGDPIRAVVAVAPDSPVNALDQLGGKKVAFPSPDAFVGYAVPMVALRTAKVQVEEIFAGNQEGAMAQVKNRRVEAAAVNSRFLAQYSEREGVRFRAIFTSEPYPELAVVAHPRVPAAVVDKVRQALLAMKTDPKAAPVLEQAKSPGFEPATDRDYEGVRRIYRQIAQ
jgi:phosphonate transport system substrate-binding protein